MTAQAFAERLLSTYPLTVAVPCCLIGGLRPEDWLPVGFQVRDHVMRVHDYRNWLELPRAGNSLMLDNGSTVRFGA